MARRRQIISATCVVLAALVVVCLWPGLAEGSTDLCGIDLKGHCHHNQSGLCNTTGICDHQLRQTESLTSNQTSPRCQMNKGLEDCGSLQPSRRYAGEKPLVEMHLYHYHTWMGQRAVVNFTFPSPDWHDLTMQYKINSSEDPFCRQFILRGVSLPLPDTLMYDCVAFLVPEETVWDAQLTVISDKGEGRTYTFRLPRASQIETLNKSPQDWHVFFYLHYDFIATSSHLPVTIQADFHEVSYNVSMVKCLDNGSPECDEYSVLSSLVERPKDDTWTVSLPIWSSPGFYAVTVQIVSPDCPTETGCYVSVSPRFEIEPGMLGVWITVGMAFFLISFLTFLVFFNHRLQANKRILQALREVQPSVLLVYLPETQQHLDLISTFADFLKNSCHLCPYLVDRDVGVKDPNCWTRDNIISADKVLFIVPGKPEAESITPIRNQWIIALNYLSGHHFTIRQVTRKVAVVILPSSGNIPCEILHVSRFKLVDEIAPLVTWLHTGTWLDEMFLWRPHIRSSNENTAHTWSEVRNAALRTSPPLRIPSGNHTCSLPGKDTFFTNTNGQDIPLKDDVSVHSEEDSGASKCGSHVTVSVFDPDIPSVDKLHTEGKGSAASMNDDLSEDLSDSGDEEGIFT
ncbi:uncharacterized protein LOC127003584 isoform X1 [Eriocheir sinensis]|uniref:uncharacterized protein LOC127003584 isoform X1 n=2 Tax=Eriocheir sinensis TaxID=95602 RepID=UPI0021CA7BD6|nr:uncharacterized protein LOC127003584 isoform X1 [Eriocheir sinensis]XP_050726448.1 uncharacterized protein LOC127003584 isoform X1 [Eriocheir sinensis]